MTGVKNTPRGVKNNPRGVKYNPRGVKINSPGVNFKSGVTFHSLTFGNAVHNAKMLCNANLTLILSNSNFVMKIETFNSTYGK